jgi:hypothetical protein
MIPPKNISKGRYNSHRNPFIIKEIHVATNEVHSKYMSQKGNEDNSQRSKKTKQGNQPSLKNFAGVKSKKKKL